MQGDFAGQRNFQPSKARLRWRQACKVTPVGPAEKQVQAGSVGQQGKNE